MVSLPGPVVKLGLPSSTGKSNAKVAFPFPDASPALQDLSDLAGSSPAAGLALNNEQMPCSPFSDPAKHTPFILFLHVFKPYFYHTGRKLSSGQCWGQSRGCCAPFFLAN